MTTVQVRIHDLSLGGCLIEAPFSVPIGRRITLRLDLPDDEWFSLRGETVRIPAPTTFAVKFIDLDETTENRLRQAIDHLVAPRISTDQEEASCPNGKR